MTASNYSCTPLTAWRELGYPEPTGRRQVGRITAAAQELAAHDRALDAIDAAAKDPKSAKLDVGEVLMGNYIRKLYAERMGFDQFDNNTDGFTPDEPSGDDAVTGAEVLTGEGA